MWKVRQETFLWPMTLPWPRDLRFIRAALVRSSPRSSTVQRRRQIIVPRRAAPLSDHGQKKEHILICIQLNYLTDFFFFFCRAWAKSAAEMDSFQTSGTSLVALKQNVLSPSRRPWTRNSNLREKFFEVYIKKSLDKKQISLVCSWHHRFLFCKHCGPSST